MNSAGSWRRGTVLFSALMVIAAPHAATRPLGVETCKVLKTEQAALRKQGVERTMKNGPEWAKVNLSEEELGRIQRYLMLQDHIKFRCFPGQKMLLPPAKKVTKTVARPPQPLPLPSRNPLPRLPQPQQPAELDLEAIRDSLHGYQDADPLAPNDVKPRPKKQRSGGGSNGDASGALEAPPSGLVQASQTVQPLTYSVRDLTQEDLTMSAGVPAAEKTEKAAAKPPSQARRRTPKKKRADWYSFGIYGPSY